MDYLSDLGALTLCLIACWWLGLLMVRTVVGAFHQWWWRLRNDNWKMVYYEEVDNVWAKKPEPAQGGGYWISPIWRVSRFYLFGVRMPRLLARAFGYRKYW